MDIARLNFSHGDRETHAAAYAAVRAASDAAGRAVGILADLQGPKLRIGNLLGGVAVLAGGARLLISSSGVDRHAGPALDDLRRPGRRRAPRRHDPPGRRDGGAAGAGPSSPARWSAS